ncbi:hypothetical protein [Martelella alba]|uniref:hypothetical protein n=1 Tax=Martelella alba TaxID=2590451 RepID=UPI00148538F8|nr:hypothetical protein [Martelella alba]
MAQFSPFYGSIPAITNGCRRIAVTGACSLGINGWGKNQRSWIFPRYAMFPQQNRDHFQWTKTCHGLLPFQRGFGRFKQLNDPINAGICFGKGIKACRPVLAV